MPPYILQVEITPECLSIDTFVIIAAGGHSDDVLIIVFPSTESIFPFQIVGTLYCCATSGEGKCSTTIFSNTLYNGNLEANS